MPIATNLPPVFVPKVFDDPEVVWDLIRSKGPYLPVMRYFANKAEMAAQNPSASLDQDDEKPMFVGPVWRGDWAYDTPLIDGVEPILHNKAIIEAAREVFPGWIVEPQQVYVNLTTPLPRQPAHVDIPAFCGIERTEYPTWLLTMMSHSGLFEDARVRICTAVIWFYEGEAGGLRYWPHGADEASVLHQENITNTAIVGDNDFMFHQVNRIGAKGEMPLLNLTLDSELQWTGTEWQVQNAGEELAQFGPTGVRTSLSWKARVFPDDAARDRYHHHTNDLTLDEVIARFTADFAAKGNTLTVPSDPLHDPAFVAALATEYRITPPGR